jgi:hypothetical protein
LVLNDPISLAEVGCAFDKLRRGRRLAWMDFKEKLLRDAVVCVDAGYPPPGVSRPWAVLPIHGKVLVPVVHAVV